MASIATEEQYAAYAARWGLVQAPAGLASALIGASAEVQAHCHREFLPSPADAEETEERSFIGDGSLTLFVDDVLGIEAVTVLGVDVPGYALEPRGKLPTMYLTKTSPAYWVDGVEVVVTGRFGYAEQASLPEPVIRAVCMLAALELNSVGEWERGLAGVKSESVLDVKIEYAQQSATDTRREAALALLKPYRRLF